MGEDIETLTDSEEDELVQLEREYERKKQLLLEKKNEKKNHHQENSNSAIISIQVGDTPPSSPKTNNKDNNNNIKDQQCFSGEFAQRKQAQSKLPSSFNGNVLKPKGQSSFGAKLENASDKKPTKFNIDLQDRIFGFTDDEIPRLNQVVTENDQFTKEPMIRRYIDPKCVTQLISQYNIKIMSLQKFYAKCSPPSYNEPNYINWMVCGFVLSKPELCTTKDGKNKYLKFFFGDWNTDIGVLVFDKAVKHFIHLVAGEIILILNPGIARKPSNGIQFKNKDNIKNIISVGLMKNYGKCKKCNRAINTAKGDLCQIHLEQHYRSGTNRMELNGAVSLQGPSLSSSSSSYERRFKYSPPEELTRTYSGGNSINLAKYDDPNLVTELIRKRKRKDDEKANQLLESKLMGIVNPTSSGRLRDLGILSESSYKSVEKQYSSDSQKGLTNANLKDLGFNPLLPKRRNTNINTTSAKSTKLQELMALAKNGRNNKSLFVSRKDYNVQQDQKTQSLQNLERYKKSLLKEKHVQLYDDLDSDQEQQEVAGGNRHKYTHKFNGTQSLEILPDDTNNEEDDDDELDIEFTNEYARKKYHQLRAKSDSNRK
ncbi:uncharacterized protein KQ657_000086 [Scheffersomyces spartinae]|uniref:Zinc finger Mcm10/DnaG-type domain-containing protein n=1 Tax=Scheffersomyces spartinae TaxID=45513 RepID=A0A9P7VDD9_9ASCO|nr:uncharacterized protein KQ657_000086 [Scheffersomyces spartinae]KAG7196075.1 hypothetical protein KQ657_000086 [Scheffersomyces spartinae]